jgi:hypothetical protein
MLIAVLVLRKGFKIANISPIKYLGGSGVISLGESDSLRGGCGVVGIPNLGVDRVFNEVKAAYDIDLD